MSEFIPLCMSREELDLWRAANASPHLAGRRAARPCSDCPIEFAQEMRLQMRCNGETRMNDGPVHTPRRLLQFREAQARRKQGLPRLRRTPTQVKMLADKVRELRAAGMSAREVSACLGVEISYVRELRRKYAA